MIQTKRWVALAAALVTSGYAQAAYDFGPGFAVEHGAVYNPVTDTTYVAVTALDKTTTHPDAWNGIKAAEASGAPSGWLATIYSAQENSFLVDSYAQRGLDLWGYRIGATWGTERDQWGLPTVPSDPNAGWYWNSNTDEPMVYANWGVAQPDNFAGVENVGAYWYNGTWNDTTIGEGHDSTTGVYYHLGFVAEFSGNQVAAAVPEPSTGALMAAGVLGVAALGWRRRSR